MGQYEHMLAVIEKGHRLYQRNNDMAYVYEPLVEENSFISKEKDQEALPDYATVQDKLPALIWDGHPQAVECYNQAWKIAFGNLRLPAKEDGMVSSYIDTAFNGFLFMWDSSFITMFGKYAAHVFDFQKTLDNFYARQHMDGFICREISEQTAGDQFHRFDPVSTGPNILPWAEWESFQTTGDLERVRRVFPALLAYHLWLKKYRTWPDGTYWTTGWACGMDNQPRVQAGYSEEFHSGFQVWADMCIQQILSCQILVRMAKLIGREKDAAVLEREEKQLTQVVNEKLWDPETAFYYDLWSNGEKNMVQSIGAYWALLADIVPPDHIDAFVAHLENKDEFNRPHRIPSLSASHPAYRQDGGYWCGGVWAPTNYMVLKGLEKHGYHKLAYDIAQSHVKNVHQVFQETGTLWENYAPDAAAQGVPSKPDFVGWTGLSPISVVLEQVFGIQSDAVNKKITWRIRNCERHGVRNYPFGNDTVTLICPAHGKQERPEIIVESDAHVHIEIIWETEPEPHTDI